MWMCLSSQNMIPNYFENTRSGRSGAALAASPRAQALLRPPGRLLDRSGDPPLAVGTRCHRGERQLELSTPHCSLEGGAAKKSAPFTQRELAATNGQRQRTRSLRSSPPSSNHLAKLRAQRLSRHGGCAPCPFHHPRTLLLCCPAASRHASEIFDRADWLIQR